MSRSGPVTRDTTTIAIGISQILIAPSAAHIATITPVLSAADSIGALANTNFKSETTFFDLESGYPAIMDATFPLKEANSLECAFKEITPKNLAIARGLNPFVAIPATETEVSKTTVLGTITGSIAVTDDDGPTTETWTVVFTSATTAGVYGSALGHVGDLADLTTAFAPLNTANAYFTIRPVSFLEHGLRMKHMCSRRLPTSPARPHMRIIIQALFRLVPLPRLSLYVWNRFTHSRMLCIP